MFFQFPISFSSNQLKICSEFESPLKFCSRERFVFGHFGRPMAIFGDLGKKLMRGQNQSSKRTNRFELLNDMHRPRDGSIDVLVFVNCDLNTAFGVFGDL